MTQPDPLNQLPTRRIKAADGMAVTADIWEEAHDYHRQQLQVHARYGHGPGLLHGLEVIASDPADSAVFIKPGVAIDPQGRTIVLAEPLTYDLGGVLDGRLYLLLSYGESRPRGGNGHLQEGAPLYVHAEYSVEAVGSLPKTPHVELARLWRQGRGAPIRDAADASRPGPNEIDLRFRRSAAAVPPPAAGVAVVHLGGSGGPHGRGAQRLARALRGSGGRPVWVDDDVPLTSGLESYTLVCLVGHGDFQLAAEQMNALYAYLQGGGTVFAEGCRRQAGVAADKAFADLFASLGLRLQPLGADHALLQEPALFGALPAGYETQGQPALVAAEGVVLSTADYGCLWQGERRSGPAAREEIRAAHEFGGNLVALAEARAARVRGRA